MGVTEGRASVHEVGFGERCAWNQVQPLGLCSGPSVHRALGGFPPGVAPGWYAAPLAQERRGLRQAGCARCGEPNGPSARGVRSHGGQSLPNLVNTPSGLAAERDAAPRYVAAVPCPSPRPALSVGRAVPRGPGGGRGAGEGVRSGVHLIKRERHGVKRATSDNAWLPLWEPARIGHAILEGAIRRSLDDTARESLAAVTDIEGRIAGALEHPKPADISPHVFNAVIAAQYYELFEALQPPRAMAVYEPCVGAEAPVIFAAEAFSQGQASYLTINLNRKLRDKLASRIAHLRIPIRIVDGNAQLALTHLPPRSFDVACFHHAVNDILQTAVSEPRGMDTTSIDWFSNERQMIEWLAEDAAAGRLDRRGRPELMQIVDAAARLVRPGGYLIFDHCNWRSFLGVAWFPWDLFANLIPMTRGWIAGSGLPLSEVHLEGLDPQWWLVLRVGRP